MCTCENKNPITDEFDKNIIENFGVIHNLTLDKISTLKNFPNETTKESYTVVAQVWGEELQKLGIASVLPSLSSLEDIASKTSFNELTHFFDSLFFDGKINFSEKINIEFILKKTEQILDVSELNRTLLAFENTMALNCLLSIKEKNIIVFSSVIARYSNEYWRKQLADKKSPWANVLKKGRITPDNVWKLNWKDILGGLGGCIVCSGGGVIGCISCAGGASSFVSNAFKE